MSTTQLDSPPRGVPVVLGPDHHGAVLSLLTTDIPANLFQLCWLDNHGLCPESDAQGYQFVGVFGASASLQAVSLLIAGQLLLVGARRRQPARRLGRWYRHKGVVLEHIVSARESVTPFWQSYLEAQPSGADASGADASGADASVEVAARLNRAQHLYVIERGRWADGLAQRLRGQLQPSGVERARSEQFEAVFLASARMHLEETLEDPIETHPDSFRNHIRHRIDARRCFAWFDEHRRLLFKADVSARSAFGAQLSGVYTAPQFRGQGIATRALFDICEELFDAGAPRVTLYVNAQNTPAHRVYRKVGFEFHTDYQSVFVESVES